MYDDSKIGCYEFQVEPFSDDFKGLISWKSLGEVMLLSAQRHADSFCTAGPTFSASASTPVQDVLLPSCEKSPLRLAVRSAEVDFLAVGFCGL